MQERINPETDVVKDHEALGKLMDEIYTTADPLEWVLIMLSPTTFIMPLIQEACECIHEEKRADCEHSATCIPLRLWNLTTDVFQEDVLSSYRKAIEAKQKEMPGVYSSN